MKQLPFDSRRRHSVEQFIIGGCDKFIIIYYWKYFLINSLFISKVKLSLVTLKNKLVKWLVFVRESHLISCSISCEKIDIMSKLKTKNHPKNNVVLYIIAVVLIPVYLFINTYVSNTMAGSAQNFQKSIYDFSVDLYEVSCSFCGSFVHILSSRYVVQIW